MIADWFTLHGIEYEYEKVYEGAETGGVNRREYRPDFYLPEFDVYLEHFGIDREGRTAPHISASSYQRQIAWKRDLHRRHGTRLLETYSYERMERRLHASLKEKITELRGEVPSLLPDEELRAIVGRPEVRETLVKLMTRFLTAFKSNQWTLEEVKAAAGAAAFEERVQAFLALFEVVHEASERQLSDRREIDFADMISRATEYVESGQYELPFTRVIVDEFQDISRGRRRFLAAILAANEDVRLFCVGDDWQSIYGFTGSDVSIMTRFEEVFGYTRRVDLDRSFRCNREILTASSRFIQQNDNQLRKQIESRRRRGRPAISFAPADAKDVADLLKIAVLRGPKVGVKSVLVLGRFSHLEPNALSQAAKQAGVKAAFMTVHKSKGLEADAVVVLDLAHGRYGFPALLEDDPLLGLVLPEAGTFEHAEERRILYVALTRARNTVLLQVPERSPSPFATELMGPEYQKEVDAAAQQRHQANCPQCGGELVRTRKSRTGYAWSCEFQPYCDGGADTCPECREGAFTQEGGRFICRSAACGHSVKTCPRCGDTPTVIYVTKKGPTRACANRCGWRERWPQGTDLLSPKQAPEDGRRSRGQTGAKSKTNDSGPYKWTREAILDALRQYCYEHGDLPTRKDAKKKIDYMPADPRTIISNLDASGWPEAMEIVAQELGFSGSRYYVKR